jgi:hypothetical protein
MNYVRPEENLRANSLGNSSIDHGLEAGSVARE